jgi:hypothetical protein
VRTGPHSSRTKNHAKGNRPGIKIPNPHGRNGFRDDAPSPVLVSVRVIMTTKEEVTAFIAAEFPQTKCVVREVGNGGAKVSHEICLNELRPGGTVSGPVLMGSQTSCCTWPSSVKSASSH